MIDNELFGEYQELLKEIIDEEVEKKLKEANIFRALTGTVLNENEDGQNYDIDIVDTKLKQVTNKTGQKIPVGSTVTVLERYGSNYTNSYISIVNGTKNNALFDQSWSFDGNSNNSISINEKGELIVKDANGKTHTFLPKEG